MKNTSDEEESLRIFYAYHKIIINLNEQVNCEGLDRDSFKKSLDELDTLHTKLQDNKNLLTEISNRLQYMKAETINLKSFHFLRFLLCKKFKDYEESEDSEIISSNMDSILSKNKNKISHNIQSTEILDIESIFNLENTLKPFYSQILSHKSMYNSNEISETYILDICKLMKKAYFYEHFFLWFEDYFQMYLKTTIDLLNKDGFLQKPWRYYIAIMAASTMKCEYLYRMLEDSFLEYGGDESWLIYGLDVVPEKLANLARLNNILAHQPWKILTEDIKEICTKKDSNDVSSWNLSEFMQASLILVHIQRLSIIVASLDVKLKEKHTQCDKKSQKKVDEPDNVDSNLIKNDLLKNLERINSIKMDQNAQWNSFCSSASDDQNETLDLLKEKETLCTDKQINYTIFNKHTHKYCNVYHDFDPHSEEFRSYLEFNWQDHAYYILRNYHPNGIDCIHQEIEYLSTLTTNSLGDENSKLNTFPIRYAICCYVEKILGYVHEDYNYSNVNKLLNVSYKTFIKNVACYPHKLKLEDFNNLNMAFNNEEILHIILLVSIIKERTQMTYLANCLYEIIKTIE